MNYPIETYIAHFNIFNPFIGFFYFFTIVCTILVIYSKNIIHSILFLIAVFINVIGLLIISNLDFISLIIFILYIGAIAVLFLFINMMLDIKYYASYEDYNKYQYLLLLIIISILVPINFSLNILLNF
jgi:NADH:ubiquinone oxidoreductase subunit 6 (subunit J)